MSKYHDSPVIPVGRAQIRELVGKANGAQYSSDAPYAHALAAILYPLDAAVVTEVLKAEGYDDATDILLGKWERQDPTWAP